jgi:formylglycine-generating enzyme required for sulfatase activity
VRITSPFYMAPIECTGGLWRRITGKTLEGNAGRPATNVTWEEIQERVFAELNKKAPDGMVCRLPTEAEWEYACRAGTATPFHYGSTINSDRVNFNANYGLRRENQEGPRYSSAVRGKYRERPIRPGSFPPNAWGLHDMHGNVWEWCLDLYDPDFYKQSPADDPLNAEDEETSQRVLRGGCFNDVPADCRSANRSKQPQDVRDRRFGFRIVLAFE